MEENMEENTEKNIEEKNTEKNTEKNIEEYSGSSSSQYSKPRSPRSNYSNYNNSNYSNYNNSNYSNYNNSNYSNYNNLRNLENDDWKLFILLASMKRFEDYTYLFIIVWGAIELNSIECSEEFNDEIGQMYSHIEDLFTNSVIRKQELDKYLSLLDNYRDHCYNDSEAKKELVTRASKKLGKCGLITKYSHKLSKLKLHQYKLLRQMILDRMESFVGISRQSHPVDDEGNSVSLDDPIELRKEIESLRKQNTVLVQENSHYQAKLGDMTNTRLGDQDPNNAAKLISDIKELQQLLSEFTIVQGPEYQINVEKSAKLLTQYKCQTNLEDSRAKLILGGVLQQCIIMQILSDANSYFGKPADNRNLDETVEVNILNTTERLIQQFNHFNEKRPGNDDITPIIPVKVRQQVHAALGYRGFSNDNHPFIVNAAKRIRNAMNEYRKILDSDILNEVDAQSIQITRKVINIFCFRLKTQQIEPKHKFFQSGDEVDTRLMQGSWGREDVKKLEVEVCYFPYIGIFDDNVSNQKIFTKAQVYTRPKKQNDTNSTESSGSSKSIFNMVKSVINK